MPIGVLSRHKPMKSSQPRTRRQHGLARSLGAVLLLLMYMAQPVMALQDAFCGCGDMTVCACSDVDAGMPVAESCCAKKAQPAAAKSCCGGGEGDAQTDAESVCHCPPKQVDSTPSGVVFDGQDFEGPFAWWSLLEGHAGDWNLLAPHLGGVDWSEHGSLADRQGWPPGGLPALRRAPTSPKTQRLLNRGLIAFLADLSVADL